MAGDAWPIDAVTGAPSYTAAEHRQQLAGLTLNTTADEFGARAGRRPGPGLVVTCPTNTTYSVSVGSFIAYPRFNSTQGPYLVQFSSAQAGSVTAADATRPRLDILYVIIDDDPVDGSLARQARIAYLAGSPNASPVAPAVPARGALLATIRVEASGGGANTVTRNGPLSVAAGGLLPVGSAADESALTQHAGLQIVRTDLGDGVRKRSNGTAFVLESSYANGTGGAVMVAAVKSLTIIPASGSQVAWTISGWASAPVVTVSFLGSFMWHCQLGAVTSTQINAFVTNFGAALPDGTAITLHAHAVGIPTPGSIPTL